MPALRNTVRAFMARLPELDNPDSPLSGSEAVEVLADYWDDFKQALAEDKKEHRLAYDLAEALNEAYSTEMDRKDEARNFEDDTLAYWKTLLKQSITVFPRKRGRP